ncbi:hypothetical protein [Modicisalibacter radicis]|uniref:hypothetical protein n=1 Tax=Halomonas sp. EAR18 TaxID=2518972 RepID=UPI001443BD6A|nr:hypothetical protein [Halomonas sp. EAR18]
MEIIEVLTVSVATVALLSLVYAMSEKQRRPIRKEVRIEHHEHPPGRNRRRHG